MYLVGKIKVLFVSVGMTLFLSQVHAEPQQAADKRFDEAVKAVASQISDVLKQNYPNSTPRLWVLPFGDDEGKVSVKLGNNARMLQYSVVSALEPLSPGKFLLTAPADLPGIYKLKGIDPLVFTKTDAEISAALPTMGIQAVYLGRVLFSREANGAIPLGGKLYTDKGTVVDIANMTTDVPVKIIRNQGGETVDAKNVKLSGRFNVEVLTPELTPFKFADGKETTYGKCCVEGSSFADDFHNVLFLTLPKEARGKPYVIRVTQNGKNPVPRVRSDDPNRIFLASIFVDGVSTFLSADAKVASPLPWTNKKWVLTPPGKMMVPNTQKINGYDMVDVSADSKFILGHAQAVIAGFQKDENTAKQFLFVQSQGSIAYELDSGAADIGLISVYFYAQEDTPMDLAAPVTAAGAGTNVGPEIISKIFNVKIKALKDAVEVWKIHYRFEDDKPNVRVPTSDDLVMRLIGPPQTGRKN